MRERPPENGLVIVYLRIPGSDYVGKIHEDELQGKDQRSYYIHLWEFVNLMLVIEPGKVHFPMVSLPKMGLCQDCLLIPRQLAVIAHISLGGKMWETYRKARGEVIQTFDAIPDGMAPPGRNN